MTDNLMAISEEKIRDKIYVVCVKQVIYLLMMVLKGDSAVKQSNALIRIFKKTNNKIHDRYVIIDYGKRITTIRELKDKKLYDKVIDA